MMYDTECVIWLRVTCVDSDEAALTGSVAGWCLAGFRWSFLCKERTGQMLNWLAAAGELEVLVELAEYGCAGYPRVSAGVRAPTAKHPARCEARG